jgi:Tfp pilus assembly protein PilV
MTHARKDIGESLIEVVMTIVIVGLTVTALISSLATAGNAGNVQRSSVQADVVMRGYAEATKAAAQGCAPGTSYVVVYSSPGYTFAAIPSGSICPSVAAPQKLTLVVTTTSTGVQRKMYIRVASP